MAGILATRPETGKVMIKILTSRSLASAIAILACLLLTSSMAVAQKQTETSPMDLIVVTGTMTERTLEDAPVQTHVITAEQIIASGAQTISDLLGTVPGYNFSQQVGITGAMGYKNTVRGLNVENRYLLILVDGHRVYTGYRAGGMAGSGAAHNVNAIPLELIDHVEIISGPASSLYGADAMVGVMNIITKTTNAPISAGASYTAFEVKGREYTHVYAEDVHRSMRSAHALVTGHPLENLGIMLFVKHEQNEGIHTEPYDIRIDTVYGRVDWRPLPNLEFILGGEYDYWHEENDDLTVVSHEKSPRMFGTIRFEPAAGHELALDAYTQRLNLDINSWQYGTPKSKVGYDSVSLRYTLETLNSLRLLFGGEFLRESFKADQIEAAHRDTRSLYAQAEWSFFDGRLAIIPGARYDSNSSFGSHLSPKLTLMAKPDDNTTIRATVGSSFKTPPPSQTHGAPINMYTLIGLSNPNLKPETGFTWQVGVERRFFDQRLTLSATYFDMRIKDMIVTTPTGDFIGGLPVWMYNNVEETSIRGLEASMELAIIEGLTLETAYANTSARNLTSGARLNNVPTHALTTALNYRNPAWKFGASISGTHTSAQLNDIVIAATPEQTVPFTRLDLSAWKEIGDGLMIRARAGNLFNSTLIDSDAIHLGRSLSIEVEYVF